MIRFRHPIILLLVIILDSIFGPETLTGSFVNKNLLCLLQHFDLHLPWEAMGAFERPE